MYMYWLLSPGSWYTLWTALVLLWTSSFCTSWQLLCFHSLVSVYTHTENAHAHVTQASITCNSIHTLTHTHMEHGIHMYIITENKLWHTYHTITLTGMASQQCTHMNTYQMHGAEFTLPFSTILFTAFYVYGAGNNIVSDRAHEFISIQEFVTMLQCILSVWL